MAKFSMLGLEDLELSMQEVAQIPGNVMDEMLNAQADIAMEAQRAEAKKLGKYQGYSATHNNFRATSLTNQLPGQVKSYSTGTLARSIKKRSKVDKDGRAFVEIYFSGSRKRGKTRTRNSEIAFLNEFGTRTINARRFIWVANEKIADKANAAAMAIYDRWLKSKDL